MEPKKKILVYWHYYRKDLLVPFIKLNHIFDWHFILYKYKEEDLIDMPFPCYYWGDYSSARSLLDQIRPSSIIFFELSSLYAVSLNIVAKESSIPTFVLEHGIKLSYDYYIKIESNSKPQQQEISIRKEQQPIEKRPFLAKFHLLKFYLTSFSRKNIGSWYRMFRYIFDTYVLKKDDIYPKIKFAQRAASKYLLISRQNLAYYEVKDGITEKDACYFGNPYLDDFTKVIKSPGIGQESYYLLLDDGNIESFGVSSHEKSMFFSRLNEYALLKGHKLFIKLHPYDYGNQSLYRHPNITIFENHDASLLLRDAAASFAISSTMALPLIPEERITLFRLPNCSIQDVLEEYGVPFVDFYNFTPEDLDSKKSAMTQAQRLRFIDQFLFKNDGHSIERLEGLLR